MPETLEEGLGGGPGVQRAGRVVPFCARPEAAVIFVFAPLRSLGPARRGGRVLWPRSETPVTLAGRAFTRLPRVWERAPRTPGVQSGWGLAAAKCSSEKQPGKQPPLKGARAAPSPSAATRPPNAH